MLPAAGVLNQSENKTKQKLRRKNPNETKVLVNEMAAPELEEHGKSFTDHLIRVEPKTQRPRLRRLLKRRSSLLMIYL